MIIYPKHDPPDRNCYRILDLPEGYEGETLGLFRSSNLFIPKGH